MAPRRRTLAALLLAALGVLVPVSVSAPAYAGHGGFPVPLPTSPEGDPPGANDWSCKPTARRPTPVILVHGTFGDRKHLLEALSKALSNRGFCVYSLDYGNRATQDIARSARELKSFTQRVRRATGAAKVSMVGHSQGGMMPRYFIKFLGGARMVDDLVGMAPSNHGTRVTGRDNPLSQQFYDTVCYSCGQQAAGSAFLRRLNRGDETPGRVSYTQLVTKYDEVVVPYRSGYLTPGPRTSNITIQRRCPTDRSEHLTIPRSRTTIRLAIAALSRRGPAPKTGPSLCG